jgi:hypothetical protein
MNVWVNEALAGHVSKSAKFLISRLVKETLDDLTDSPPELVEDTMLKASAILYYVATGQVPNDAADEILYMVHRFEQTREIEAS